MPSGSTFLFDDPSPFQNAIRAAYADVVPTGKGEYKAELTQINLHQLWLQRGYEQLPRILDYTPTTDRAPIAFSGNSNRSIVHHDGRELSGGEIIITAPGSVHYHRSAGPTDLSTMSLRPEDLAEAGRVLAGREMRVPSAVRILRPSPELFSRLRQLHEAAVFLATNTPDVLAFPEIARALENELVHVMVRCLTDGETVDLGAGHRRHRAIMARFKNYLAANSDKPLYLSDLCAATGTSERTLRSCCQDHFGMGPMRYLWLRRMRLAHTALLVATPETTTVTRIAADHGFWELGRFANEYRMLFGELPSTVLRREPSATTGL
jgi:AraC-like DNA-binding protein